MPVIQNLIVDAFGAHIGKHSQRLKVTRKGEVLAQAPLIHLQSVTIANRGVSISAEAVRECTERGIPIHFLSGTGKPYASLYSAGLTGTAATRRAQLLAYDQTRAVHLAIAFSSGKIQNQSNLLKYFAKYRKQTSPEIHRELHLCSLEVLDVLLDLGRILQYPEVRRGEARLDDLRAEIMGLEGRAARTYWRAVRLLIPEQYAFEKRIGRGATDAVNSALNYGYGILYSEVERALVLAGLDPYAGFLHADRPGKPSLTLDLIEEFRQPVVDRTVIGMTTRNMRLAVDEEGLLPKETRRLLAEKVLARLEKPARYAGKRHPLRAIIQMQARHLATFLRGERPEYLPFEMQW
ncbi:MAG: CRISPR-associated endonuclease Cas1 [Anaerolineae bacterium]|nr:MAG: CRISPR-associated endonuclease Cas1 [Anaerolineae bacterium]